MAEPREGLSFEDFWEQAHREKDLRWLSGYDGPEIWARLDVEKFIRPNAVVLNIGVGTGACTRALRERGSEVHAVDISVAALDTVRDVAKPWHVSQLKKLPAKSFDLALSHIVSQHMLDDDLIAQLAAVIRALDRHGILAMQFSKPVGEQVSQKITRLMTMGGANWRTPEDIEKLAKKAGGKVIASIPREQSAEHKWAWHVVHIGRKDYRSEPPR